MNLDGLAGEVGVSATTIENWMDAPTVVYDGESYSSRESVRCLAFRELSSQAVFC